jgi:transcriptional regulator with XRE-family HTH domain
MKHDASRMRIIRENMGMTQEKLAILSNVSERTVQRAEAGATMRLDTLADFAAALQVPLSELVLDVDNAGYEMDVSLRRLMAGRAVLDDLVKAGVAVFDCEVDPNDAEMEEVLTLIRFIEGRLPTPWEFDQHPAAVSLSEKVQFGSDLTKRLERLAGFGIGLFGAPTWISAKYPYWDSDEGCRYTRDRQPYERVMMLRLVLARSIEAKIYRKPQTGWGLDEAPPVTISDFDDGVPF